MDQAKDVKSMLRPRLRVGVVPSSPGIFGCFAELPEKKCRRPGYEVEVFDAAMKLLGWDYGFLLPDDAYDAGQLVNGSWTGLMGMMARGEIDATAFTMRLTAERLAVADYAYPASAYHQVFVVRRPKEKDYLAFILKSFTNNAWFTILGTFLALALVSFLESVLKDARCRASWKAVLATAAQSLWVMLSVTLKPPYLSATRFNSSTLHTIFLLAIIVVFNSYTSFMQSVLIVPLKEHLPFRDAAGLVSLVEERRARLVDYLDPPGAPLIPDEVLAGRLAGALASNPVLVTDDHLRAVQSDDSLLVTWETEDSEVLADDFTLMTGKEDLVVVKDASVPPYWASFMTPKGSPYRRPLAEVTAVLIPFAQNVKARYVSPNRVYDGREESGEVHLSLRHLAQPIGLLAAGIFLSLVSFAAEGVAGRLQARRRHILALSGAADS